MKARSIQTLTILLFVNLILGFMLYKGGYLFPKEKKIIINDEKRMDMSVTSEEDYDVDPFKDLKLEGGFVPRNFRKLYTEPYKPSLLPALASSKSMVLIDFHLEKQFVFYTDYESMLIGDQFSSEKKSKQK